VHKVPYLFDALGARGHPLYAGIPFAGPTTGMLQCGALTAADIDAESRGKMDTIVTVKDMQQRLSELLQRAAQGERVIIRQPGKPSLALMKLNESEEHTTLPRPESDTQRQHLERAAGKLGKRFRLAPAQQRRLEILGQKNKQGTLTEAERTELFELLHTLEELARQKAQALAELP